MNFHSGNFIGGYMAFKFQSGIWLFPADATNKITYFRVALVGDEGSEKDNVRRAYVQLSSNLMNQIKADQMPVSFI